MESGTKLCMNGSKGYEDIFSVEYQVKETLLHVLLIIMFFGGFLAMLSNSFVLFFGLTRRNLFPPEILSLAVTDFLTGLLGTPSVMAIYYFSELISSVWGYVWNQRYLQRDNVSLHLNNMTMIFSQSTPDLKATLAPIKWKSFWNQQNFTTTNGLFQTFWR